MDIERSAKTEHKGFPFVGHLGDAEAMKAMADELCKMPDPSAPIAVGDTKTVGELIQDLENRNEVGIHFLGLRRRVEELLRRTKYTK